LQRPRTPREPPQPPQPPQPPPQNPGFRTLRRGQLKRRSQTESQNARDLQARAVASTYREEWTQLMGAAMAALNRGADAQLELARSRSRSSRTSSSV
jgi:hypothetical protein